MLRRVMEMLRPAPARCLFCPGPATDAWFIDPFGKVQGICSHCLERPVDAGDRSP
jgi:hypothetical protein